MSPVHLNWIGVTEDLTAERSVDQYVFLRYLIGPPRNAPRREKRKRSRREEPYSRFVERSFHHNELGLELGEISTILEEASRGRVTRTAIPQEQLWKKRYGEAQGYSLTPTSWYLNLSSPRGRSIPFPA